MPQMRFAGVMPAITTPFREDFSVDHGFLAGHVRRLLDAGATGIIPLGSLGEGNALRFEEKCEVLRTCVSAAGGRPVTPGVASLSTGEAVELAGEAERIGCLGLMVLPPYVHNGKWHETEAHLDAVIRATGLPCMLYNNPIAYGADALPDTIARLADRHPNLRAVKESSGDLRRITAIKALVGERLDVLAGLDDLIVEGIAAGATGWVAGLVNALPEESLALFERASRGGIGEAGPLYRWFLPLLRLDTVPEFVQLIKLVQLEVGMGSEVVRPPRLRLPDADRDAALGLIRRALTRRPSL